MQGGMCGATLVCCVELGWVLVLQLYCHPYIPGEEELAFTEDHLEQNQCSPR